MAGETAARVRQLIEQSGLTQAEFAAKAGLDAPKMSKSLSGVRRFTSLDLARIADLCGVSVDWLLGMSEPTPATSARAATDRPTSADAAVKEAERLAQLRADLAFLGYRQEIPRFETGGLSRPSVRQGRDLATQATALAAAKGYELWRCQDLAGAVEAAFGVDVRVHRLAPGFDGLSWSDANTALMVVATSEVPARQRFTIAHELGHLLAGDDQGLHLDVDIHAADHRREPSERRANAFAAELLLPAEMLHDRVRRTSRPVDELARLACELWVSPSTLAWQLFNLQLIDKSQCDSLRALTAWDAAWKAGAVEALGEWIQLASRPRLPGPLVRTTFQAYAEGKATLRPFANLIGSDTDTLRQAITGMAEGSPLQP
ncbi:XRE family transcriptional regulator [Nonomuraea fastidiosa]|jgi:Zn-dependent peptidase ImmA (M78 family)/transcriptional regulator with XRE-family HTH domain|uniref:helix-turn-helix domain-containing protein n=1 Tax=Nonomuraea TaxID=83681 RepID=UPI0034229D86